VDQRLIADGYVMTFWRAISDGGGQYASAPEIAAILGRLRRITALEELRLPPLDPSVNAAKRTDVNTWLGPHDRA